MATKAELEVEVEQLKAQLAAAQANAVPPPTDAQVAAGNDTVIAALRQEVENLGAQLKLNEATVSDQNVRLTQLELERNSLAERNEAQVKLNESLEAALRQSDTRLANREGELRKRLEAELKAGTDGLVVGGTAYKILLQGRMQDICDAYEKNECEDDDLTVVLRKA